MQTYDGKPYPDKLFYKIQEVSDITGVKPYVLRYWETEFPALNPEKDGRDQRRYRKSDIELILLIKKLLHEERYTIAGARKQLGSERKSLKKDKKDVVQKAGSDVGRHKQLKKIQHELHSIRSDLQALVVFLENKK